MSKFSGTARRPRLAQLTAPVWTTDVRRRTGDEAAGPGCDTQSELVLLAIADLAGETTVDERARFAQLVHQVTETNPTFIAGEDPRAGRIGLAQYLRQELLLRSASVVMAAEYVAAGGAGGRSVVARVLQRADEPAELLRYWIATHGRRLPMPIKRGVADAVRRLYSERAAVRYDGATRTLRMADVLELTHPEPSSAAQSALFRYLLDRRHHGDAVADPRTLPVLAAAAELATVPAGGRRALLRARGPSALTAAGLAWDRLTRWLPGGMDAEGWEAVIPSMDVTALVRNLCNFHEAGIGHQAVESVTAALTDPSAVARARLSPLQAWAAYSHAPSDAYRRALGRTLELTSGNVPALPGTLVVIDTSGSMRGRASGRCAMARVEVAAVMAVAAAKSARDVDVVIYGHGNVRVEGLADAPVVAGVERVVGLVGSVGHATFGHTAVARRFDRNRHRRAVLFTDDQQHDAGAFGLEHVPLLYTFDLGRSRPPAPGPGGRGRYTLGGFTDATFSAMSVLEAGADARWPF
jgi:hypothetical protein